MLPQPFSAGVHQNVMMSDAISVCLQDRKLGEYSSQQKILLVGEGDFSFSSALASAFGTAANVTATSLDSIDDVVGKYGWAARAALSNLFCRGAFMYHNVDATKLDLYPFLSNLRFDRIVWNFPHAGTFGREKDEMVILNHRNLLGAFFSNVSKLLTPEGEVHVSHQSREPYLRWKLGDLAQLTGLQLRETVPFRVSDYPGYCNRRGAGEFALRSFGLRNTETYKFVSSSPSLPARSFPLEAFQEIGRMPIPHINNPAADHYSSEELANRQRSFSTSSLGCHPNLDDTYRRISQAIANQEPFIKSGILSRHPKFSSSMGIPTIPFSIQHGPSVNFKSSINPSSAREVRWALQPLKYNFLDCRFSLVRGEIVAGDLERPAISSGTDPTILGSKQVGASERLSKIGTPSVEANALENATICTAPESTKSKKKSKKKKKEETKLKVQEKATGILA